MRNWRVLNDMDFEEVVTDLLAAEWGHPLHRFGKGQDGGVDLHWQDAEGTTIVVQCKHYMDSNYSQLRAAATKEVPKVKKLNPTTYWFVTSQELTMGQKEKLYDLFRPWMAGVHNVVSGLDLDHMLDRHEQVERKHTKFWLSTGMQLYWATHTGIVNRSENLKSKINQSLSKYVGSSSFDKAQRILRGHHVCLIAGEPGIGKTTLAHLLLASALREGFEVVEVSENISEAWDALVPGRRQAFLYDDFLGQISLDQTLGKKEGKSLIEFIEKASREGEMIRLVLTTREYIFNDARRVHQELLRIDPEMNCVLEMREYSRYEKGRILYNHLIGSGIPLESMSALSDGGWRKIVDHRNYNPRLVEYCTRAGFLVREKRYLDQFEEVLENPQLLWDSVYENYLDEDKRSLLLVLASFPDGVEVSQLSQAHRVLCEKMGTDWGKGDFKKSLKQLEGTFLQITELGESRRRQVSLGNPSITEFLLNKIANDPDVQEDILETAQFFEQLQHLHSASVGSAVVGRAASSSRRTPVLDEQVARYFVPAIARTYGSAPLRLPHNPMASAEARMDFVCRLESLWSPGSDFVEERATTLIDAWANHRGERSLATRLLRPSSDNPAIALRGWRSVNALEGWLWATRGETGGWAALVDFLDTHRPFIYTPALLREFEDHAVHELEAWDPVPPDFDSLASLARRFGLRSLEDRFVAAQAAMDEAVPYEVTPSENEDKFPPTADSEDDQIEQMFEGLMAVSAERDKNT